MDASLICWCTKRYAGKNGLFGEGEEQEKLVPGIEKAAVEGINVSGPHPADTVFFRAVRGDFDLVVACYHDQGHVPIKVLGLEEGVNITVGLNGGVIRTSVDHGTAFDIAGYTDGAVNALEMTCVKNIVDVLVHHKKPQFLVNGLEEVEVLSCAK